MFYDILRWGRFDESSGLFTCEAMPVTHILLCWLAIILSTVVVDSLLPHVIFLWGPAVSLKAFIFLIDLIDSKYLYTVFRGFLCLVKKIGINFCTCCLFAPPFWMTAANLHKGCIHLLESLITYSNFFFCVVLISASYFLVAYDFLPVISVYQYDMLIILILFL